jgi:glycosyltransferase involved in cell wall biosynthesis
LLGDVYIALNQLQEAAQSYQIALTCKPNNLNGVVVVYKHAYSEYPHMQLANLLLQLGDINGAKAHVDALKALGSEQAASLEQRLNHMADLSVIRLGLPKTEDVVITCPPGGAVTDWDEHTLEQKGHGGSETAAIEVAKWIKLKTKRNVKIFQPRVKRDVMPSGVEYLPSQELMGYLQNIEPAAHIAWRHSVRLTNAKSYIWCHDLQCPGAEHAQNYDKIVALSGFHKDYLKETSGVPEDKIVLGFNGINTADFPAERPDKDPLKVVFSSSPDRGLVQSIDIVKKARELSGLDIKLHCFYGTANMRKMGMHQWADAIENKIKENDFVIYHGMVPKKELMQHFFESAVWLYPADFIETYCITAIEALCAGVWPIVRDMGALKFTMKEAIAKNMCDVLTTEVKDEASVGLWANTLVKALIDQKWRQVKVEPQDYSWEKVADFFIKEFDLLPAEKVEAAS